MERVFSTGGPTERAAWDFIHEFEQRFPELAEHIKTGRIVSHQDSHILNSLVSESSDMKYAVAFYLRKYIVRPTPGLKNPYTDPYHFGVRWTDQFVDSCFTIKYFFPYYQNRQDYLDALLDFMADKPRLHKQYFDTIKSWEATVDALARASRGTGGGSGGKGGSNGGNDGPQGFDPL